MLDERMDNAFGALDILARADATAFADATNLSWKGSYIGKDGLSKTITVMAMTAEAAQRLIVNQPDFVRGVAPPVQARNDASGKKLSASEARAWAKQARGSGNTREFLERAIRGDGYDDSSVQAVLSAFDTQA